MAYLPKILASGSASAAATLDINMSAYYNLYDVIQVTLYNILPSTNAVDLYVRVSVDGTTYDSGANNYQWSFNYGSGGNGNTLDTGIKLGGSYGTGSSSHGTVTIWTPGSATYNPKITCHLVETDGSGNNVPINGAGARLTAQLTKGLRFYFGSGNITANYKVTGY